MGPQGSLSSPGEDYVGKGKKGHLAFPESRTPPQKSLFYFFPVQKLPLLLDLSHNRAERFSSITSILDLFKESFMQKPKLCKQFKFYPLLISRHLNCGSIPNKTTERQNRK